MMFVLFNLCNCNSRSQTQKDTCSYCVHYLNAISTVEYLEKGCSFNEDIGTYDYYEKSMAPKDAEKIQQSKFCYIGLEKDVILDYFNEFDDMDFIYAKDSSWIILTIYANVCRCCRSHATHPMVFEFSFNKRGDRYIYKGTKSD